MTVSTANGEGGTISIGICLYIICIRFVIDTGFVFVFVCVFAFRFLVLMTVSTAMPRGPLGQHQKLKQKESICFGKLEVESKTNSRLRSFDQRKKDKLF